MGIKGWAVTMGIGAAVGAVAVAMLPRNSATKRIVNKAAWAVEDAAAKVGNTISDKLDI